MNDDTEVAIDCMFKEDIGWRKSSLKRLQRLLEKAQTWQSALAQLADELDNEYALMWKISEKVEQSPELLRQLKAEQPLVASNVDWMVVVHRLYLELSFGS
ncbi:MAG: hypothetical protein AB4040_12875 [Synechococcus sp.]